MSPTHTRKCVLSINILCHWIYRSTNPCDGVSAAIWRSYGNRELNNGEFFVVFVTSIKKTQICISYKS